MLTITVGDKELFDERNQEFVTKPGQVLELEHSLVSVSKWESITEKPFLGREEKSLDETLLYVQCMTLNGDFPIELYTELGKDRDKVIAINEYISAKNTATWFREEENRPPSREIVTAEVIYHWLVALQIPFEVQHWHLNRLLTLVRVCNEKSQPPKQRKTNRRDMAAQRRALNQQRMAQMGSSG